MADEQGDRDDLDEAVRTLMQAARSLVAVAARSLDDLRDDLTFPQYRALVVLATRGPRNVSNLAGDIGVHQSTASRLAERLVDMGLVERRPGPAGRHEVLLGLTAQGTELTDRLRQRRRDELQTIVARMDAGQRQLIIRGLAAFAEAAGEEPEQFWPEGWSL